MADIAPVPAELGAEVSVLADAGVDDEVKAAVVKAEDALGGLDMHGVTPVSSISARSNRWPSTIWTTRIWINLRAHAVFARAVIPHLRASGSSSFLHPGVRCRSGRRPRGGAVRHDEVGPGHVRPFARPRSCGRRDPGQRPARVADTPFNAPAYEQLGGYDAFLSAIPELTPLGRVAGPDEIGRLAAWILTASRRITSRVSDRGRRRRYASIRRPLRRG